jgi:hypothetical protein
MEKSVDKRAVESSPTTNNEQTGRDQKMEIPIIDSNMELSSLRIVSCH